MGALPVQLHIKTAPKHSLLLAEWRLHSVMQRLCLPRTQRGRIDAPNGLLRVSQERIGGRVFIAKDNL